MMDITKAKRSISELQQQALIAGTRCSTLKSQLNYMKMIYYDTHPRPDAITEEFTRTCDDPAGTGSVDRFNIEADSFQEDPFDRFQQPSTIYEEKPDVAESTDENVREIEELVKSLKIDTNELNGLSLAEEPAEVSPRTYVLSTSPRVPAVSGCPDRETVPIGSPFDPRSTGTSGGPSTRDRTIFEGPSEAPSGYLVQELASLRQDPRRQELMHIARSVKSDQTPRRKTKERKERPGSSCKIDEVTTARVKRKRGRLRSSNSRSTVTTNLTNATGKRDGKKRSRQRGWSGSQQPRIGPRARRSSNEVVEIYHNSAAKEESSCAISGGYQRPENRAKNPASPRDPPADSVRRRNEARKANRQSPRSPREPPTGQTVEAASREVATSPITMEKCERRDCVPMFASRSYEMPTLASKLKQANRCCFGRFSFRNIPFVVGTSVNPSHNLGLNIQQVLSMMKTRQPSVNGLAPLLIRKVSRGIEPISVLIDQMNGEWTARSPMIDVAQNENLCPCRSSISSSRNQKNPREQMSRHQNPSDARVLMPFVSQQVMRNQPTLSRPEDTFGNEDLCRVNSVCCSQSSKGIREVLVNLHDQFEEMNTRYEELQAKAEKSGDENLRKEMSELEKELNVKEEEINAVVGLYKEVMALKHQMKRLQDRNSLICISTEVPMNNYSSVPFALNRVQSNRRRSGGIAREPSASIRLTGLLRQIQTFQKQLKFVP